MREKRKKERKEGREEGRKKEKNSGCFTSLIGKDGFVCSTPFDCWYPPSLS